MCSFALHALEDGLCLRASADADDVRPGHVEEALQVEGTVDLQIRRLIRNVRNLAYLARDSAVDFRRSTVIYID